MFMGELILRRLALMVLTMFIVSLTIFLISELVPIDLARNVLGQFASPESLKIFREQNGLMCSPIIRYTIWLVGDDWVDPARHVLGPGMIAEGCNPPKLDRQGLLFGDLGYSMQNGSPVAPLLFRRLGNSAILAGIAFLLIMPISVLLGLIAGLKEHSITDRVITVLSLVTTSTPTFALGALMVVVLSIQLHLLPGISALTTESNVLQNPPKLVMPILCLFFAEAGYVARMTRASMVEVMASPYIRTAVLKGLPYRTVVFKHAMKNALLAPITVIMLHIGWLLGGTMIVETMFGFPGIGTLLLNAALSKDVPIIEAGALFMTLVATSTQLLADLSYMYLNPRIRYT
jgi:peptide/nickel transport system permease protein